MDKFIVSARKYRPQTFDTVVGQNHITTTLKNAIKNKQLAHAFLFCGPRGVGKTTCARILAKTINCESPRADGEACNVCQSCISFNDGASMNIHELDAASNNSVDDIRSLADQVRFAPQAGAYKVYIIDEVHMLSSSAFNAFLKTLEEPPPYAIFILATTEKHKILPTILSRCQIFDFKRITPNDTVEHLQEICAKEHITAAKAALQVIAQKSEGCMRDALSILDKIVSFTNGEVTYQHTLEHLNILDADYYFKLMQSMQEQDLAGVMLLFDDINKKGFEEDLVLNGFSEFIRNLLVCKDERIASLLEVVESFKERYASTAKNISSGFLISALNILNETEIHFKGARNKRLHAELALIRLTYLSQALQLTSGAEGLSKKKPAETARPIAFRQIPILQTLKNKTSREPAARLTIIDEQEPPEAAYHLPVKQMPVISEPVTPVLKEIAMVKEAMEARPEKIQERIIAAAVTPGIKTGRLEHIRKQIADKSNGPEAEAAIALEDIKLQEYWKAFSVELKENKNPAFQSFEMATLVILDGGSFEVVTNNNLEQRFIEQEKRKLSEYLQKLFCNKALHFAVRVTDKPVLADTSERPLSKKEQFQKMAEQYPLVKELKDKLRLELDY